MVGYPHTACRHLTESLLVRLVQRIRVEHRVGNDAVGGRLARDFAEVLQEKQKSLPDGAARGVHHTAAVTAAVVVGGGLLVRSLGEDDQLVPLDDDGSLAMSAERAAVDEQPFVPRGIWVHLAADDRRP